MLSRRNKLLEPLLSDNNELNTWIVIELSEINFNLFEILSEEVISKQK